MIPPGWRLVPWVPSEKQIAAALRKWFGEHGPFFTTLGDVQRGYMRDAYTAMLEASPPPPEVGDETRWKPTHRHVKRGSEYQVIAFGELQVTSVAEDETPVTIYRGANGAYYVRPTDEFNDGRFAVLSNPTGGEGGDR